MEQTPFDRRTLQPQTGFNKHVVRDIDIWRGGTKNPFWGKSPKQVMFPCAKGVVYDKLHNYRTLARCGKWTCEYCGDVKKRSLQSEIGVLRERHRGLPVFSVLTFVGNDRGDCLGKSGIRLSDDSVKAIVRRFCVDAGKILGTKAWVKLPEPHKDGRPHWNIMWFGVRKDFTSCPILGKNGKYDMRLQCRVCDACKLRDLWRSLSGAERSTHVIATGSTASYVTKYITKTTTDEFAGFFDRFRRYSFSRSCKRSPAIVPVYRFIANWLKSSGLWRYGVNDAKWKIPQKDYFTDYWVFTRNETKFEPYVNNDWRGFTRHREICSAPHESLCDVTPYWSPTRVRAWGGIDEVWSWFSDTFGYDTMLRVVNNIKYTFNKYKEILV